MAQTTRPILTQISVIMNVMMIVFSGSIDGGIIGMGKSNKGRQTTLALATPN